MKLKRILPFLLALVMLASATSIPVLAAYEKPAASEIEQQLDTEAGEQIVYDCDFEGVTVTPDGKTGEQNVKSTLGGCTQTTGSFFKTSAVLDYWVNDGYQNIFSDGSGLVYRAHEKDFASPGSGNDDNNCLQLYFNKEMAGKDFVIAFDVTQYHDSYSGAFTFYIYSTRASGKVKTTFLQLSKNGCFTTTDNNGKTVTVADLRNDVDFNQKKSAGVSIALHVRMDATEVVYDLYVDGVRKVEGVQIKNGDVNYTADTYVLDYVRFMQVGGVTKASDADGNSLGANGAALISLDSARVYCSDVCYEAIEPIDGVSLKIDEDLAMKYYVNPGYCDGTPTMSITAGDKTATLDTYTEENGKYVFTFDGIGPHQIADKVDAVLLVDGETVGEKSDYSVTDYCREVLALYPDDAELKALVNDLILYGAAAAEYKELDSSAITEGFELAASETAPSESDNLLKVENNTSDELYVSSVGVRFDYTNKIFFKVFSPDGCFTAKLGDKELAASDFTDLGGGYYVVYSDAISATCFDADGAVSFTLIGEGVEARVEYTVNSYAYYMNTAEDAKPLMKALAIALYRYGASAEAYAAKLDA